MFVCFVLAVWYKPVEYRVWFDTLLAILIYRQILTVCGNCTVVPTRGGSLGCRTNCCNPDILFDDSIDPRKRPSTDRKKIDTIIRLVSDAINNSSENHVVENK